MIGVPIDALKDLIAGRDMYKNDYFWNSLFRIAGVSKYNVSKLADRPEEMLLSYALPVSFQVPMDIIGQLAAINNEDSPADPSRLVTLLPFSDLWYYRYGPGIKTQEKKRYRKITESQEAPIDIEELLNL